MKATFEPCTEIMAEQARQCGTKPFGKRGHQVRQPLPWFAKLTNTITNKTCACTHARTHF